MLVKGSRAQKSAISVEYQSAPAVDAILCIFPAFLTKLFSPEIDKIEMGPDCRHI